HLLHLLALDDGLDDLRTGGHLLTLVAGPVRPDEAAEDLTGCSGHVPVDALLAEQVGLGVDVLAVAQHHEVQVWAGGVAGRADAADLLPRSHDLAHLRVDLGHVVVPGGHPVAVVDDDDVAALPEPPGLGDDAAREGADGGPGGGRHVCAPVVLEHRHGGPDRKSTRLNSSHVTTPYRLL